MGCLRTIGCLTVLVLVAGGAYVTRDLWHPPIREPTGVWEPVTARGADRTQHAVDALVSRTGPPFEVVSGADFAAYALKAGASRLPSLGDSVQAAVVDDELRIRGTIARLHQPFEMAATVLVVAPERAELRLRELTVHGLPIPPVLRHVISQEFGHGAVSRDSSGGVLFFVPAAVRDIRVARGHITLYKNAP